jgi:hypothetical protein
MTNAFKKNNVVTDRYISRYACYDKYDKLNGYSEKDLKGCFLV